MDRRKRQIAQRKASVARALLPKPRLLNTEVEVTDNTLATIKPPNINTN